MDHSALASSADCADALLTARKAKNILGFLIALMLVLQLGLFFAARYKIVIDGATHATDILKYLVGLTDFLGMVLTIVLDFVLILIVLVMLQGRLLGVSHVVSAFISCLLLTTLLFPWQAFLINATFTSDAFKIPGVLYTWSELVLRARAPSESLARNVLFWARFVGWPVAALLLLLKIQYQSAKGLGAALGDAAASIPTSNQPPAIQ